MPKKYVVRLTDGERETLSQILKKRGVAAQKVRRASMLLKADVDGPCWVDAKIAEAFGCHTQTVENIRESLVAEGLRPHAMANPRVAPAGRCSTGSKKPRSSRCGWVDRRKDFSTGRCACWPHKP